MSRERASGFTLIEVLVALGIIGMSIIIISNTWGGNLLRLRKSALNHNIAILLERKVTELEVKYRDRPLDEVPEEEAGDFGSKFPQYRWTFKTQPFEMPDISAALVGREGGADQNLLSLIKQVQEFIGQSMKEGKVSVIVKAGKREITYSVVTYFVDYNRELTGLPGAGGNALGGLGAANGGGTNAGGNTAGAVNAGAVNGGRGP